MAIFFFLKHGGKIPIKKYIIPSTAEEAENISQVVLNLYLSSRAPPNIGPTIVPIDPAMLKAAAALSFIYELSYIPSFS